MTNQQDRDASLAAFDQALTGFVAALNETPPAALRYRPVGEDYALGGLAVHVGHVLERYTRVLDAMRTAEFGLAAEPAAPEPSERDTTLIRDGFDEATRPAVLDRVRGAHASLIAAVRAVPDAAFETPMPVTFDGAAEPYATSPADVVGWVRDHYVEHIHQISDLRAAWREKSS